MLYVNIEKVRKVID